MIMASILLAPIGTVQNNAVEKVDRDWGRVISKIVLNPEYRGGLAGLETFSHALILTWLHEAHFDAGCHLQRRPQGREDMPLVGIFAQRVKDRPNPLGLTAVKIKAVGDDWLEVLGLDAINGTPVLDIKPYFPCYDRPEGVVVPGWVDELMKNYF
jgi:tRNA (adenine37-N6)-methyltransferase